MVGEISNTVNGRHSPLVIYYYHINYQIIGDSQELICTDSILSQLASTLDPT